MVLQLLTFLVVGFLAWAEAERRAGLVHAHHFWKRGSAHGGSGEPAAEIQRHTATETPRSCEHDEMLKSLQHDLHIFREEAMAQLSRIRFISTEKPKHELDAPSTSEELSEELREALLRARLVTAAMERSTNDEAAPCEEEGTKPALADEDEPPPLQATRRAQVPDYTPELVAIEQQRVALWSAMEEEERAAPTRPAVRPSELPGGLLDQLAAVAAKDEVLSAADKTAAVQANLQAAEKVRADAAARMARRRVEREARVASMAALREQEMLQAMLVQRADPDAAAAAQSAKQADCSRSEALDRVDLSYLAPRAASGEENAPDHAVDSAEPSTARCAHATSPPLIATMAIASIVDFAAGEAPAQVAVTSSDLMTPAAPSLAATSCSPGDSATLHRPTALTAPPPEPPARKLKCRSATHAATHAAPEPPARRRHAATNSSTPPSTQCPDPCSTPGGSAEPSPMPSPLRPEPSASSSSPGSGGVPHCSASGRSAPDVTCVTPRVTLGATPGVTLGLAPMPPDVPAPDVRAPVPPDVPPDVRPDGGESPHETPSLMAALNDTVLAVGKGLQQAVAAVGVSLPSGAIDAGEAGVAGMGAHTREMDVEAQAPAGGVAASAATRGVTMTAAARAAVTSPGNALASSMNWLRQEEGLWQEEGFAMGITRDSFGRGASFGCGASFGRSASFGQGAKLAGWDHQESHCQDAQLREELREERLARARAHDARTQDARAQYDPEAARAHGQVIRRLAFEGREAKGTRPSQETESLQAQLLAGTLPLTPSREGGAAPGTSPSPGPRVHKDTRVKAISSELTSI